MAKHRFPVTLAGASFFLAALVLPGTTLAQTDTLVVAPNGKVGVRTATPAEALHISGGRLLLEADQWLAYKNGNGQTVRYGSINSFGDFIIGDHFGNTGNVVFYAGGVQRIRFNKNSGTSLTVAGGPHTEATPDFNLELIDKTRFGYFGISSAGPADGDIFVVNNAGRVGIGNNAPAAALDVAGNIRLASLGTAGSTAVCRNAQNELANCSSSRRYKTDVERLDVEALPSILNMAPVTFRWRPGTERAAAAPERLGLIAEDVARQSPLLIFENEQGEVEGIDQNALTALLVKALQEQQTVIDELRDRVRVLEQTR